MTLNRRVLKRGNSPRKSPKCANTSMRKKALIKTLSGEVQFGAQSKANLKVVVRIRPPNSREVENGDRSIISAVDKNMMIFDPKDDSEDFFYKGRLQRIRDLNKRPHKEQKFIFERVFQEDSTNQEVYEETTKDIVNSILDGYNCSVFAYGATGAGKTFTMLGKPETPGITFLTLMELFRKIEVVKEEKTCEVGISYLEVYNETVRDLLKPGKPLNVQENGNQVLVPGLSLHKPADAEDLMKMLESGNLNRTQHPTDANAESSRSHAVFQVFVKQQDRTANLKSNVCIAKLSMIDLAGSERGTATGYTGARFREGANINRSLLSLGNCINALADGLKHVPYRDSKLTRLLKDSLGGNCRSIMVAAVSPAASSFEDTFNTLRYANRAKTIKTSLKKNLLNVDQHVTQYVKIVEDLREEICSLKEKVQMYEEKEVEEKEVLEERTLFENKIACLEEELQDLKSQREQSMCYSISDDEKAVQERLKETIRERKALRRELLQLESSQRQTELKIYTNSLHLRRMKIISFASQKLDKSISKCERTIRNLTVQLEQAAKLQNNVEQRLHANLCKVTNIQEELIQWGHNNSQPSQDSKSLIEKNEASVVQHEMKLQADYLSSIVKESVVEQESSETLICQLLDVFKEFYVQLRANGVCSPEMERLFEGIVDRLDESKIIWADQKNESSSLLEGKNRLLDIERITKLPVIASMFVSPALQENKKIFRRSIMKSRSTTSLPDYTPRSVQVNHSDDQLGNITEEDASLPNSPMLSDLSKLIINSPYSNEVPSTPVLSEISNKMIREIYKPSPVLGRNYTAKTKVELPTEISPSSVQIPIITTGFLSTNSNETSDTINNMAPDDRETLYNGSDNIHMPNEEVNDPKLNNVSDMGFISMLNNDENVATGKLNNTVVLEDSQSSDYAMNSTFAVTPAKELNTTIDLPLSHKPMYVSNLSTTKAFQTSDIDRVKDTEDNTPNSDSNCTFVLSPPCLNVTMDMPPTHTVCNESPGESNLNSVPMPSSFPLNTTINLTDTAEVNSETESVTSRKLFDNKKSLNSTFSLDAGAGDSPGCKPLDPTPLKQSNDVVSKRFPLASIENECDYKYEQPKSTSKVIYQSVSTKDEKIMNSNIPQNINGVFKKPLITPHKTPLKTSSQVKDYVSMNKNVSNSMRRSKSTSSLGMGSSVNGKMNVNSSPVFNRKSSISSGLGGALRRMSSFSKNVTSKYHRDNQENLPPTTPRSYLQVYSSFANKENSSSITKPTSDRMYKT